MHLRHTDFVVIESKEGVEEKKRIHVKVRLDFDRLYVDLNGKPITISKRWQKLKKIQNPDPKDPPLTCKPRTKQDWKIEIGADRQEKTFILYINGIDFRSLMPHVEERSLYEAEVARSFVEKSEPGERKKM